MPSSQPPTAPNPQFDLAPYLRWRRAISRRPRLADGWTKRGGQGIDHGVGKVRSALHRHDQHTSTKRFVKPKNLPRAAACAAEKRDPIKLINEGKLISARIASGTTQTAKGSWVHAGGGLRQNRRTGAGVLLEAQSLSFGVRGAPTEPDFRDEVAAGRLHHENDLEGRRKGHRVKVLPARRLRQETTILPGQHKTL
jgi:hypothetical protein